MWCVTFNTLPSFLPSFLPLYIIHFNPTTTLLRIQLWQFFFSFPHPDPDLIIPVMKIPSNFISLVLSVQTHPSFLPRIVWLHSVYPCKSTVQYFILWAFCVMPLSVVLAGRHSITRHLIVLLNRQDILHKEQTIAGNLLVFLIIYW